MLTNYNQLQALLSQIEDTHGKQTLRHVDLWNRQVEFLEVEQLFLMPACFIEFMPLQWECLAGTAQRGTVLIRLHIISEWNSTHDDTLRLDTPSQLFKALHGKKIGDSELIRIASEINHDHDNIIDSIETYRFKITTPQTTPTARNTP